MIGTYQATFLSTRLVHTSYGPHGSMDLLFNLSRKRRTTPESFIKCKNSNIPHWIVRERMVHPQICQEHSPNDRKQSLMQKMKFTNGNGGTYHQRKCSENLPHSFGPSPLNEVRTIFMNSSTYDHSSPPNFLFSGSYMTESSHLVMLLCASHRKKEMHNCYQVLTSGKREGPSKLLSTYLMRSRLSPMIFPLYSNAGT